MGLFRRRKPAPAVASADAGAGLARADREEQAWREGVEEHGWLVFDIRPDEPRGDGDGPPGFQFTVGLTQRGLPEMIVYGLPEDAGMGILNDLADRLIAGESFSDGQPIEGLVRGEYRLQLWDTTWLQDPLGAAFRLYGEENVKVRQLVIPDRQHRLPWEDEYETPHLQPLLFTGLNGVGPRRAGDEGAHAEHAVRDNWDLPLDPHLAVLTTRYVSEVNWPPCWWCTSTTANGRCLTISMNPSRRSRSSRASITSWRPTRPSLISSAPCPPDMRLPGVSSVGRGRCGSSRTSCSRSNRQ